MAKRSKTDKLEMLRKKLANTDMGGSSGFWSPKQGSNVIRLIPPVGEMEFFFQEVGRHYFSQEKQMYCPSFTTEGELECPACELVQDLYNAGDKASRTLAGKLRVRKMYWMNVVIRSDSGDDGPFIYTPGVSVFSAIAALINDPDYGWDIIDLENGIDLVIEREGTGLETSYQVIPRRKASAVPDADEIISKARDLSWVEVSENPEEDKELSAGHAVYLLPYDRLLDEFDLDLEPEAFVDEDDDEEDEPDEGVEEEHPVKREVRRRRRRRSR